MALTQRQLNVWNCRHYKTFGISYNEEVNKRDGLPAPEIRKQLKACHEHLYGICYPSGKISIGQYKKYIEQNGV